MGNDIATADEVMQLLTRIMRSEQRDYLKAAEMLAKHFGLLSGKTFEEKVQITFIEGDLYEEYEIGDSEVKTYESESID